MNKLIVSLLSPGKVGDEIFILIDGTGKVLDELQPAIVIRESSYEEYMQNGGKLDDVISGRRFFYEVSAD